MMKTMSNDSTAPSGVAVVLAIWFGLIVVLGASGTFVRAPGALPFPVLIGATAPVIVFLSMFGASPMFRNFVLSLELPLVAAIQAWRFAGFGFVALYAYDVLPGLFAWPAGLGDIAVGLTAPWMALALARKPSFASSRSFIFWNLFGILDLVVAVGTGALSSVLALDVTTAPMAQLPLVLIPAYFVPIFVMVHLATLFQARRLATSEDRDQPSNRVGKVAMSHSG
jgi:hypothetical protein